MTRVIVGPELSRDEKFLKATSNYFRGNSITGFLMLNIPFGHRITDMIAWPLWKYHQTFRQDYVLKMLYPVVERRMYDFENGSTKKERFDAIECCLKLLPEFPFNPNSKYSPVHTLSHEALQLLMAGGMSPGISMASIVFKMLEEKHYMKTLRDEAKAAVDKHGWTDPILNEMPKMDSFIRETHRMHTMLPCR